MKIENSTKVTKISHPAQGILGYLHEVEVAEPTSILIFQLPRATNQLSGVYIEGVMSAAKKMLPKEIGRAHV